MIYPTFLWRLLCGLRGHDLHLTHAAGEIYIGCGHCGKRSAGWSMTHSLILPQVKEPVIKRFRLKKAKPAKVTQIAQRGGRRG